MRAADEGSARRRFGHGHRRLTRISGSSNWEAACCACRVEVAGMPVGGWSSAPPQVVSDKQRKADTKVGVIAAIIIGLIVFGIVRLMDMPRTNPEDTVRQYLAYVANGDAESALGMQSMPLSDRERRFLTNDVLSAADTRIVVESVEGETSRWRVGKFARVEATMSVNGERFTHEFLVYRRKPTKDNPAEWYLRDGLLVRVTVTGSGVPGFSVRGDSAGVEPLSTGWQEYYFFPGVYTLTPEGRSDGRSVDARRVVAIDGKGTAATENASIQFSGAR